MDTGFIRLLFFLTFPIVFTMFITHFLEERDMRKSEIVSSSVNIYSMKPKSRISGEFVLGFGRIEEKDYYIYLVKHNGGFIRQQVPTEQTLVVESDEHPKLTINEIVNTKYMQQYDGQKRFLKEYKHTLKYEDKHKAYVKPIKNDRGYKYIISIPKGSITENKVYEIL